MDGENLLGILPLPVFLTDAEGRLTFYNKAAAEFWGYEPPLGEAVICGSWRLYWPDGREMAREDCPVIQTIRTGEPVHGVEFIAEKPDGTRTPIMPVPNVIRDATGRIIGSINLIINLADKHEAAIEAARLAAIVSSSDDAIIGKSLDGLVMTWNASAARMFGYEPGEIIGQPILRIVPPELHGEEFEILAKLKRGERIEHFDTVRVTKDGRRINVSLTVSPIRDSHGRIVGSSKVARDISHRKRAEEMQRLLFDELNHRVKNTLAIIQAIASQSLRRAARTDDFVTSFNGRLQALARAHDLLVEGKMRGTPLADVIREQVVMGETSRIAFSGPSITLDSRLSVQLALVLHELATNARKYGALSVPSGSLSITWNVRTQNGQELHLTWQEKGVPDVKAPESSGFGTTLIERSMYSNGGETEISYNSDGILCRIRLPLPENGVMDQAISAAADFSAARKPAKAQGDPLLKGKRILVVEDEPLVAMDLESQLLALGCIVVGPAPSVGRAMAHLDESEVDAALVDANLGGERVGGLAAALTRQGIPFAFATGYERSALPRGFQDVPLLAKPFDERSIHAAIRDLLSRPRGSDADVVAMRARKPI